MTLHTARQLAAQSSDINQGARDAILEDILAGEQLARQLIELPELLGAASDIIRCDAAELRHSETGDTHSPISDELAHQEWRHMTDIAARLEAARETL